MSDVEIKELEWYLRDHLFRQSNAGRDTFRKELLPSDMATLYLRYRAAELQQLSKLILPVLDGLIAKKVLEQEDNDLKLYGRLSRLQCSKCFYINYLAETEQRFCLRCQHGELHDFPRKKA